MWVGGTDNPYIRDSLNNYYSDKGQRVEVPSTSPTHWIKMVTVPSTIDPPEALLRTKGPFTLLVTVE